MSPRRSLMASLLAAALLAVASPAMAMTPKAVIPEWSPSDPPLDRTAFDAQLVAVGLGTVNDAGPGPTVIARAKAK